MAEIDLGNVLSFPHYNLSSFVELVNIFPFDFSPTKTWADVDFSLGGVQKILNSSLHLEYFYTPRIQTRKNDS